MAHFDRQGGGRGLREDQNGAEMPRGSSLVHGYVCIGLGGRSPDVDAPGPAQTRGGPGGARVDISRQDARIRGPRRRVQAGTRLQDQRFESDHGRQGQGPFRFVGGGSEDNGSGETARGTADQGQGVFEEEKV